MTDETDTTIPDTDPYHAPPKSDEVTPNPKTCPAPLDRTWTNPDAARMWLKRHPQPGLKVAFDHAGAVYRLIPWVEAEPDFAQEPSMTKAPRKAAKAARTTRIQRVRLTPPIVSGGTAELVHFLPKDEADDTPLGQPIGDEHALSASVTRMVQAEAAAAEPGEQVECGPETPDEHPDGPAAGEAIKNLTIRDTWLVIGALPESSIARVWALEFARKLDRPILIMGRDGELIETVTKAMAAAKKQAAGSRKAAKASEPKAAKTAPEGKRLEVVRLCMRPEGASTKELIALTTWKGCPWRWTIGNNKNGTGLADKFGYGFHAEKVGEEVRYFLTAAPAQAAA